MQLQVFLLSSFIPISSLLSFDSNIDIAPSVISFTDKNGKPSVMALWMHDYDGEIFVTKYDRDITYSIFDGTSWSRPSICNTHIASKENIAMATLGGTIAIAYTQSMPNPNYKVYSLLCPLITFLPLIS